MQSHSATFDTTEASPPRPLCTAQLLVAKTQHTSTGSSKQRKKIRPDYYGQALTSDQVIMMIEQKEKEKLSKKKSMGACILHTHIASCACTSAIFKE